MIDMPKKRKKEIVKRKVGRNWISADGRRLKRRKSGLDHITRRKRQILYEAIRLGMTRSSACNLAGITYKTFSIFLDRGKDKTFRKNYRFRKKIEALEAESEKEALNVIRQASRGGISIKKIKVKSGLKDSFREVTTTELAPQWQAAAWFLERKKAKDWGRDNTGEDIKSSEDIAREIAEAQKYVEESIPMEP